MKKISILFILFLTLFPILAARETVIPLTGESEVVDLNSRHLQVDSRGRIYLADRRNSRILAFSPDGKLRYTMGQQGEGPGDFKRWFGLFAICPDDRVLQADFYGGNRSLTCFSAEGKLLWVHKIKMEGHFGTDSLYPTRDGRLILGISHGNIQTEKGELVFSGDHTTFRLAEESGELGTVLADVVSYSDFSDTKRTGWPAIPFRVEVLSAYDSANQRLAFLKDNEGAARILDIRTKNTTDYRNGFSPQLLTTDRIRSEATRMMNTRGRESFRSIFRKMIEGGSSIETHLPIVDRMIFNDQGELLMGSLSAENEEGERENSEWTIYILDRTGRLKGPVHTDQFPSVIRNGTAYSLVHNPEQDCHEIRVKKWRY